MAHTGADLAAEWTPLSALTPWADNPRDNDHAVDAVAKSIQRFGFGAPIVARRENGEIIKGHTRFKAAKKLGLELVPVRFMDIGETEAHQLALADNKLGEIADWDDGKLTDALKDFEAEGMLDLGWEKSELEALLSPVGLDSVKWKTFDGSVADGAKGGKKVTCPECEHKFEV